MGTYLSALIRKTCRELPHVYALLDAAVAKALLNLLKLLFLAQVHLVDLHLAQEVLDVQAAPADVLQEAVQQVVLEAVADGLVKTLLYLRL